MNHQIMNEGKIEFSDDALIPPSQVLAGNKLVAMGYEIHFCKHLTFIRAKNGNMNEIVKEDLDEFGELLYIDFNEPDMTRIVLRGKRTSLETTLEAGKIGKKERKFIQDKREDTLKDIQAENETRRSLRN